MANPSLQIGNNNWAIKEDNLLGYSTAGTRFVPQPITMTRATLGTRVNPSGLVENVELLGSELVTNGDFSTSGDVTTSSFSLGWKTSASDNLGVSIVNNQLLLSRPVGENTDYGKVYATNGVNSINVKPSDHSGKTFKLEFEIVSKTGTPILRWYNNGFITFSDTTLGKKTIYFTSSANRLVVFIQEHEGSSITLDNISLKEATIDNLPRVDYTDGTSSLLVEPQRTNLITYSEDFSQSSWANSNISESISTVLSPDGTTYSYKLTNDAVSGNHFFRDYVTVTSGVPYTLSVFIKKGTRDIVSIGDGYNTNILANFDLTNGTSTTVSATSSNIESFNDGWFKCTATTTPSTTNLGLMIFSGTVYAGEDESGDFYVWGAQMEEASYATSYIKTSGSTVTRNQETYTKTGISDKINSEEGVLFAEMAALSNDGTIRYLSINDGTSNNRVTFLYYSSNTNIRVIVSSGGTNVMDKNSGVSSTLDFHKVAIKWKENDFAFWLDGVKVQTDTSGLAPIGLNTLSFDVAGSGNFFGKVKQLQIFKTALTDSELATLTT